MQEGGFTLIELMVSISIFLIVMVICLGAVLAIVDGNKKAQSINSVSNNLNSAIESMVRDIKTGFGYSCGSQSVPLASTAYDVGAASCGTGENVQDSVAFISTISGDKRSVKYEFVASGQRGYIQKTFCPAYKTSCTSGDYISVPITSPDRKSVV